MLPVWLFGDGGDTLKLQRAAHRVQQAYCFSTRKQSGSIPVSFSVRDSAAAFYATRDRGVAISLWQSEGICAYARVPRETYSLTLSMLGIIQWRALQLNDLLEPEDFLHSSPCTCLFERRLLIEENALLFERPHICRYCMQFYEFLCPKKEIRALKQVVQHTARATAPISIPRTPLEI